MTGWRLTPDGVFNALVIGWGKRNIEIDRDEKEVEVTAEIALAAQKRLVEWLLEEGYLYSARDEGSQEEGLLLPMEAWQALCKELGVKDA